MRQPEARIVELIEVIYVTGMGIEGDAYRTGKAYFWKDGSLLVRLDPHGPVPAEIGSEPNVFGLTKK